MFPPLPRHPPSLDTPHIKSRFAISGRVKRSTNNRAMVTRFVQAVNLVTQNRIARKDRMTPSMASEDLRCHSRRANICIDFKAVNLGGST
jgi:hypothetical protein